MGLIDRFFELFPLAQQKILMRNIFGSLRVGSFPKLGTWLGRGIPSHGESGKAGAELHMPRIRAHPQLPPQQQDDTSSSLSLLCNSTSHAATGAGREGTQGIAAFLNLECVG